MGREASDSLDSIVWRRERADRFGVFLQTAGYFQAAREAILSAKREVILLGWDLHTRVELIRGEEAERADDPTRLGDVLETALERNPDLEIRLLIWDFSMVYALEREWKWFSDTLRNPHPRLHYQLDDQLPASASHHQKVLVIDRKLGFAGGADLSVWRWETSEKIPGDTRRIDPKGETYKPYHDVHTVLIGDACNALVDLCLDRWERATGESLPECDIDPEVSWPSRVPLETEAIELLMARTFAAWKEAGPIREIEDLYLENIRMAERFLYFENQYFSSSRIGEALLERIREPDGPEIVLVLNNDTEGMLEESTMGRMRDYWFARFREAGDPDRVGLFFPVVYPESEEAERDGEEPAEERHFVRVYMHAKVLVVDDCVLRIGSANLSNRSMRVDSELDLEIAASEPSDFVRSVRGRLLASHLGVSDEKFARTFRETGSLVRSIERLRGTVGKSLRPIETRASSEISDEISRRQILDPDEPIDPRHWVASQVERGERSGLLRRLLVLGAFVSVGLVLGMALKQGWVGIGDSESVRTWMEKIREAPYSAPILVGVFLVAGLVGFPLNALLVAAVVLFGTWTGFACAYIGSHLSAVVGFLGGRWLGKSALERFSSTAIAGVNRRLGRGGILPVALIRILPIAPFPVVNFAAGSTRLSARDFHLGTIAGMGPGMLTMAFLAGGVERFVDDPGWAEALQLIVLVVVVGIGLHWILSGIRRARGGSADATSRNEL